jgi:hypothetical protein
MDAFCWLNQIVKDRIRLQGSGFRLQRFADT